MFIVILAKVSNNEVKVRAECQAMFFLVYIHVFTIDVLTLSRCGFLYLFGHLLQG